MLKKLLILGASLVVLTNTAIATEGLNPNNYQNLVIKSPIGFDTFNTKGIEVHSIQIKTYETGAAKIIFIYEITWQNGEHEARTSVFDLKPGYDYYNESVIDGKVY